jgi:hypothetical protein
MADAAALPRKKGLPDGTSRAASGAAGEGEGDKEEEEEEVTDPGAPPLELLSFPGDADAADAEEEAEAALHAAIDAAAARGITRVGGFALVAGAADPAGASCVVSLPDSVADAALPAAPVSAASAAAPAGIAAGAAGAPTDGKAGAAQQDAGERGAEDDAHAHGDAGERGAEDDAHAHGDAGERGAETKANASKGTAADEGEDDDELVWPPRISVLSYVYTGRAVVPRVPPTASASAGSEQRVAIPSQPPASATSRAAPAATAGATAIARSAGSAPPSSNSSSRREAMTATPAVPHAALIAARQQRALAAAEADAAADSPFLRRALQLAARAPTDLSGLSARRNRYAALPGASAAGAAGGAGSAVTSDAMIAAGGDDGGAVHVIEQLRSEGDHEGVIATLVTLPRLVRAMAADTARCGELVAAAPQLLRALLTLEDRFALPDFGLWRMTAMVSLAVSVLPLAAGELLRTLFAADLSEGFRLEILDVLVSAAREASGSDPPVIPETPWEMALRMWRASRAAKLGGSPGAGRIAGGSGGDEGPGTRQRRHAPALPPSHAAGAGGRRGTTTTVPANAADPTHAGTVIRRSRGLDAASADSSAARPAAPNLLADLAGQYLFYPLLRGILTGTPQPTARSSKAAAASSNRLEGGGDEEAGASGECDDTRSTAAAAVAADAEGDVARMMHFAQCPRMLADPAAANLLAQSLRALAVVLECTRRHPSAPGMARSLLALAWGLKEHRDAGVRRACISCLAAVVAATYLNASLAAPSVLLRASSAPAGPGAPGAAGGAALVPAISSLLPTTLQLGWEQQLARETEANLLRGGGGANTPAAATAQRKSPAAAPLVSLVTSAGTDTVRSAVQMSDAGSADSDDEDTTPVPAPSQQQAGSSVSRLSGTPLRARVSAGVLDSHSPLRKPAFVTMEDVAEGAADGRAEGATLRALPVAASPVGASRSGLLSELTGIGGKLRSATQTSAVLAVASTGAGATAAQSGRLGVSSRIRKGTDRALAESAAASLVRGTAMSATAAAAAPADAQEAGLERAASEALLSSLLNAGAPTAWEDLQEVVSFLYEVEGGDPDADARGLASAILNNDITRTLLLRPLQMLEAMSEGGGAGGGVSAEAFAAVGGAL